MQKRGVSFIKPTNNMLFKIYFLETAVMYKMKNSFSLILIISLWGSILTTPSVSTTGSLVVSSTEPTKESNKHDDKQNETPFVNPKIYAMDVTTNVSNRYATTLITSKVRNLKKEAAETTFSVILPENAFVSGFSMEIDGKIYKAYVKEKEEARQIYQKAIQAGQGAGHVELSARDSKTFTVSVNIEPESKTIFRLTYEELLQRQQGRYEIILNVHPGQIVDDLNVQVHINESRPLTFVRTPSLRTGNEISKNDDKLKPTTDTEIINSTSAIVKFDPDKNEQKQFADLLGTKKENGLAGQFVVQYDVERDPQGGEILVRDGYFVHFFAPSELEPLPKHVVFVLDHSGSMSGRKIEQLIEAMQNILSDLNTNDVFNIVRFSGDASVWDVTQNKFNKVGLENSPKYGNLEPVLRELNLPDAVEATKENVGKAKEVIKNRRDMGSTNIIEGLEVGLFLTKKTQEKFPQNYQPMIVFLTDGQPNVGISSTSEITDTVTKLNSGEKRVSIFSLSFGRWADKSFLQKLSAKNLGFSRHIFEAADASLQLQDFYRTISSPLLSNVTFKYIDGVTDVTQSKYPILFNGSELVIAGKLGDIQDISVEVNGLSRTGLVVFRPIKKEPISSLERLWAYLTVKQILKEREIATNKTELTKKALDLSLKYSFVTEVSSLVVVKPNKTESVKTEDIKNPEERSSWSRPISRHSAAAGSAHSPAFYNPRYSAAAGSASSLAFNIPSYSGNTVAGWSGTPFMRFGGGGGGGSYSSRGHFDNIAPRHRISVNTPRTNSVNLLSGGPHGTTTTVKPPLSNSTLPQWLETMKNNNENITTPQGTFKLGDKGIASPQPGCSKTPTNDTVGDCTIIFDCPSVFPLLTDLNVYLQYFCPLNEYAGVCCPKNKVTLSTTS